MGEVDIKGGRVSVDGIPLDGLRLGEIPELVLGGGGDLKGKGAGGQSNEGDLGKHLGIIWY